MGFLFLTWGFLQRGLLRSGACQGFLAGSWGYKYSCLQVRKPKEKGCKRAIKGVFQIAALCALIIQETRPTMWAEEGWEPSK